MTIYQKYRLYEKVLKHSMIKNNYDVSNKEERRELFDNYLINKISDLNFSEFEEKLAFLCNVGLSHEWLDVVAITIGEIICPISLSLETSMNHLIEIKDLLTLAEELNIFDDKTINDYIKKLNTKSFTRISVLSEIKIASSYYKKGYKIRIEPSNGRIGRSGLEGKCDLGVNFRNQWIYFEITRESHYESADDPIKIAMINGDITEQIKKQNLLSWRMKINARITDKNKVIMRDWKHNFLEHIRRSAFKINSWKEFDGIKYVIQYRIPDEPILILAIPVTDTKKRFNNTIKRESKQIPEHEEGVIAIELKSMLHINRFPIYAREILPREIFNDIIAIIVLYQEHYNIVYKTSVTQEVLDFLSIPFE